MENKLTREYLESKLNNESNALKRIKGYMTAGFVTGYFGLASIIWRYPDKGVQKPTPAQEAVYSQYWDVKHNLSFSQKTYSLEQLAENGDSLVKSAKSLKNQLSGLEASKEYKDARLAFRIYNYGPNHRFGNFFETDIPLLLLGIPALWISSFVYQRRKVKRLERELKEQE